MTSALKKAVSFADNTEKKQRNLIPFRPGQSGNPAGRPKGSRNKLGRRKRPCELKLAAWGGLPNATVSRTSRQSPCR